MDGIVVSCSKCGREYVIPINYEASLPKFLKFMDQLQIDVDCDCPCGGEEYD